jgi:hypothetical protein
MKVIGGGTVKVLSDSRLKVIVTESAFSLQRSITPTASGSDITFTLTTTNIDNGTSVGYTITNISPAVVTSGSLSGDLLINNNIASTTIGTSLSSASIAADSVSMTLSNGAASYVSFVGTSLLLKGNLMPDTRPYFSDSINPVLDSSSNNFTITKSGTVSQGSFSPFPLNGAAYNPTVHGGSAYFDGSSILSLPAGNSAFDIGSTYTIESWVYVDAFNNGIIFGMAPIDVTFFKYILVRLRTNGRIRVECRSNTGQPDSSVTSVESTLPITSKQWNHVAFSVNAGVCKIYINGVESGSGSVNTYNFGTNTSYISLGYVLNNFSWTSFGYSYFTGYISNFRIIKGTALYTSNFTPSTTPLTNVANTSLLLNFTNGSRSNDLLLNNNVFKDSSSNNLTITRNGSVTQGSFSPFPLNGSVYKPSVHGGSAYFDGSTDNLTVLNNSAFEMGSGDYTVELWMNASADVSNTGLVFKGTYQIGANWIPGFGIRRMDGSTLRFYFNTTSSNATEQYADANIATNLNTWYHIAMVKVGSTGYGFVNGQLVATRLNVSAISDSSSGITIGNFPYSLANSPFSGYISNLRIVKGTALYTSNFTPSTTPLTNVTNTSLLLNFTNGGVIDSTAKNDLITVGDAKVSTSVKKYGSGSLYFDGSGDYLTIPSTTISDFGTSPFTFECWVYKQGTGFEAAIYDGRPTSGNGPYFAITTFSDNRIGIIVSGSVIFTSTVTFASNQWNHIAVCRTSTGTNGCTVYLNGSSIGSFTSSTDFINGFNVIGAISFMPLGNAPWQGYIDDLRITKGIALYNSDFTPPTELIG